MISQRNALSSTRCSGLSRDSYYEETMMLTADALSCSTRWYGLTFLFHSIGVCQMKTTYHLLIRVCKRMLPRLLVFAPSQMSANADVLITKSMSLHLMFSIILVICWRLASLASLWLAWARPPSRQIQWHQTQIESKQLTTSSTFPF